jgi:hypothetical protein
MEYDGKIARGLLLLFMALLITTVVYCSAFTDIVTI